MALGPFSLRFSGRAGRPTAAVGEGRQAASMLQVHGTLKAVHYLLVTTALIPLFLSSVSSMGEAKWAFLMWHRRLSNIH